MKYNLIGLICITIIMTATSEIISSEQDLSKRSIIDLILDIERWRNLLEILQMSEITRQYFFQILESHEPDITESEKFDRFNQLETDLNWKIEKFNRTIEIQNRVNQEYPPTTSSNYKLLYIAPIDINTTRPQEAIQEAIEDLKTKIDTTCNEIGKRGAIQVWLAAKKMNWMVTTPYGMMTGYMKDYQDILCQYCKNSWETGGLSKDPARKHKWVKRAVCRDPRDTTYVLGYSALPAIYQDTINHINRLSRLGLIKPARWVDSEA